MKRVVDVPENDFGIYCRMVDDGMANEAVRRIVKGQPLSEILDKISAEIKCMEYHMIDCDVLVSQDEVLDIIEKYKEVSK